MSNKNLLGEIKRITGLFSVHFELLLSVDTCSSINLLLKILLCFTYKCLYVFSASLIDS